jgi:cell division transport system ATP-binding protein
MIEFKNVYKSFGYKTVFQNLSLQIKHKEFVCLVGNSGSGKTTFFNLLIGKTKANTGDILIDNISIQNLSSNHLQFYRKKVGFIFQDFKLISSKTVFENISFVLEICGEPKENIFSKVKKVLEIVKLEEKIGLFPYELSRGEQQRIAIARSIVHNPKIILADEPTANIDPENTKIIIDTLKFINKNLQVTIILATHDSKIQKFLNTRIINL